MFFCLRVFLSAGLIKSHRCGILKQILRKGGGGNVHRAKQAAGAGKTGQDRYPAGGALLWSPGGAATPRAVWLEADVDSLLEAGILQGGDVMKHLEGCPQALMLAVTLGPGVDAQIRRAGVGDIAASVASDALGSALAEQAADAAEAELRQWAAEQDKYLTGRFSPGYGDWPITVQPKVAAVLDTARRAGICVLNTNLMTPRKSVTAILGLSDHPVKGHLAGCGHCVLRTRCEYRKRGKTCASE